ncbi:MAG: hypothetical protein AB1486_00850 [Planctomycetota bacterium]
MKARLVPLLFVLLLSFVFALLEVQIEGDQGWASGLPTWRIEGTLLNRVLFDGRPFTGYHVYVLLFIALVFHLPFVLGLAWTVKAEARGIGLMMLFWIMEDFLWFMVNPAFGLSGFNPEQAWWHRDTWLGFAPRGYFAGIVIAVPLYFWGSTSRSSRDPRSG